MNIYIDKTNLESFLGQNEDPFFDNILKLLKEQLNIHFNFSKETLKENKNLSSLIPLLTSGVEHTNTTFDNSFPERPLKTNTTISFDSNQLSSIYWLDDEGGEKLFNSGAVLMALPGHEINETKKIFLNQDGYVFKKRWRIGEEGFLKWEDLKEYTLPLTEIIICDPYILSKKNGDETIHNLYGIIELLTKVSMNKVSLVLFVKPDAVDYEIDFVKTELSKRLKNSTNKKCNVTIVKTNNEHDRTILTNYKRINSGDSFTYWNDSGLLISKGKELNYESLGDKENLKYANQRVKDFQEILDFLKENNTDYIIGDRKSGFLKF
ncbi:hypothetical protein [Aquimarina rhabdastrellae]